MYTCNVNLLIIDSIKKLVENWDVQHTISKSNYIESIVKLEDNMQKVNGSLFFNKNGNPRLVVEENKISKIINDYHIQVGHLGVNKMYQLLHS